MQRSKTYDGASIKGYLDGALDVTLSYSALALPNSTIETGEFAGVSTSRTNVDIAEVVMYARALADDERKQVERYLKQRYATP